MRFLDIAPTRMTFLLAVVVSFAVALGARGQIDSKFQPIIDEKGMAEMLDRFGIADRDEGDVFRLIVGQYLEEFNALKSRHWSIIQAHTMAWHTLLTSGEAPPGAVPHELWEARRQWNLERAELDEALRTQLLAIASDAEVDAWWFELRRRRLTRLLDSSSMYRISRHSIDLTIPLERVLPAWHETEGLAEAVSTYVDEFTTLLDEYRLAAPERGRQLGTILAQPDLDPEEKAKASQPLQRAWLDDVARIDEWTIRHIATITQAIPDDDAARAFAIEVRRSLYPAVFRPSPVELLLAELQQVDSLTAEERAALVLIGDAYRPEQMQSRDRIIAALDRWQRMTVKNWDEQLSDLVALPVPLDANQHPAVGG